MYSESVWGDKATHRMKMYSIIRSQCSYVALFRDGSSNEPRGFLRYDTRWMECVFLETERKEPLDQWSSISDQTATLFSIYFLYYIIKELLTVTAVTRNASNKIHAACGRFHSSKLGLQRIFEYSNIRIPQNSNNFFEYSNIRIPQNSNNFFEYSNIRIPQNSNNFFEVFEYSNTTEFE